MNKLKKAVLVPGRGTVRDKIRGVIPSLYSMSSILKGMEFAQHIKTDLIVISGGAVHHQEVESVKMLDWYCDAYEIRTPKNVRLESRSTDTWENITFSLPLIRENLGCKDQEICLYIACPWIQFIRIKLILKHLGFLGKTRRARKFYYCTPYSIFMDLVALVFTLVKSGDLSGEFFEARRRARAGK